MRVLITVLLGLTAGAFCLNPQQAAETPRAQVTRAIGTIKNVQADSITLTPDSGNEIAVTLSGSAKILRVAPGQTDLTNATPLQAQDLQPGDRVLVRGQGSSDGHSMTALAVVVMKQSDVSAKQQHEREDWQQRGVGGLVGALDKASGTITITQGGSGPSRQILIHTSKDTIVRRYAPESVRFDDAKPAALDQIKTGDQLRARGVRTANGNELTAEEIVFGSFRNVAGTISAVDPGNNSLTVQDAISKKDVVVRVFPDSQLKKLPAEMAQRIAARLKAGNGESGDQSGHAAGSPPGSGRAGRAGNTGPAAGMGGPPGTPGNGPPDLQRFLNRIPSSALADLQKGDAVMIVSTLGEDSGPVKAIVLLAGVEPILAANRSRGSSMTLSPWTLGTGSGESEAAP
jgi:Domain of unknown function (DUF5666)